MSQASDASGSEISNSQFSNPFGYTSRRHDKESELLYFRARYYDPTTGEFTSRDPLEFVDGMSVYRGYMQIQFVDFFGLLTDFYTYGDEMPMFRWPESFPEAYQGAVDEGQSTYGSWAERLDGDIAIAYAKIQMLIGSGAVDAQGIPIWNSLPARLLRHYADNKGTKFNLLIDDIKTLVLRTDYGRILANDVYLAQLAVIPGLSTYRSFSACAMDEYKEVDNEWDNVMDLALGERFWSAYTAAAVDSFGPHGDCFFGTRKRTCTMFFRMKIIDYYDFELDSTAVLKKLVSVHQHDC